MIHGTVSRSLCRPAVTSTCFPAQQRSYVSEPPLKELRSNLPSQLRRGTGGRSSFNGHVCTVFGGSGFLGMGVCNQLAKQGTQLVIPYRGDSYDILPLRLVGDLGQVVFYHFFLKDYNSLKEAVKYSDIVINLVGRDWETKNFNFDDVHDTGARMIARACREMGVKKFVHLSALNNEEHPTPHFIKTGSRFLSSKWKGEMAVREEFPDAVIFRPADCFGQQDRFIRYWCNFTRRQIRWLPLWRKGDYTVKQPVAGADVVKGIVKTALEDGYEGKIIDCVGPHRYLLSDMLDWFFRIMRRTPEEMSYARYDLRYDPLFWLRVELTERLAYTWPKGFLVWDKVERECVSDVPTAGLDLRDLGIELTCLEDRADYEIYPYKAINYLNRDLSMFDKADPPPLYTAPRPPPLPDKVSLFE